MRPEPSFPRIPLALALRRRPRVRRGLVALGAVVVGVLVHRTVSAAEAVRSEWGPSEHVVVATRDLVPGHVLQAGDLREVTLPPAATPPGALRSAAPGRVVRALVLEGEVVVGRRLADAGVGGVAALLPEGTRAVAVPTDPGLAPPVRVGQRVDLVGVVGGSGEGPEAGLLAHAVPVVHVGERAISVALDPELVPRVVAALGSGAVTVVLVSG